MKVTPHFTILLQSDDGSEQTKWTLCYTYRAIAKIEEAIGKDIKRIESWQDLSSGSHFPVIVWGGLDRFNPEVTLDQVKDILNPDCQRLLSDSIFELMFPGVREAVEKLNASESGATADPNA
jgi:hypothetical protein